MSNSDPHYRHIVSSEWTYDAQKRCVVTAVGEVVTDLSKCRPDTDTNIDRNGFLIAAAPQLFASLDAILLLLETHASHIYYRDAEVSYADDVFKKATGQFDED